MRKILSVILTAAILLSSVSLLMFTATATDSEYTVTQYGASATLDTDTLPSENILSGTPVYYAYGSSEGTEKPKENGNNQSSAFLYDGNLAQGFRADRDGFRYYNGLKKTNEVVQAATNCRLVLNMGKGYNVTKFLVAGSSNQFPITSFEIYAGNDNSQLFNAENKVAEYTRTEGSTDHQYLVTLEEAVNAEYFGVKILEVDTSVVVASTDSSIYLNELGAYGTLNNTVASQTTLTETSIIHGAYPVKVLNNSSQSVSTTVASDKATSLGLWTNGRITDNVYNLRMWNAHGGMKIAYDLGNSYDVSKVVLSSGDANGTYTYVAKWEVYASDSLDNLFDSNNCYANVNNTTGSNRVIDAAVLGASVECRYVGIKIVANADTSVTTSYISEIAVYGEDNFTKELSANITQMFADNVIYKASQSGTVKTYAKQGLQSDAKLSDRTTSGCHGSTGSVDVLYNNSLANTNRKFVNATSSDNYGFHNMAVVFETETEYTVDSALVSIANKEGTVSYIAYVGDSKDTLFRPENILAICDNEDGLYNTYCVNKENTKTGKVFGILITGYTVTSAFNVDEIAFFEPLSNNVEATTATAAEGKNILSGKDLYQGSSTAVGTAVKTADGNGVTTNNLTNNIFVDVSNEGSFGGKGLRFYNGATANFTYDMDKTINISKIVIAGGKATSGKNTMALAAYGVYVGDSDEKDTLYTPENRVALFINEDYAQAQSFDLSSLNLSGQYVGIMIYGMYDHYRANVTTPDTALYLTEFAVYGNYITDAYTITNEPSQDALALKGTNAIASATTDTEIDNAILTDGTVLTDDAANAVQITDANGTKLTYNLGKVMNVTSLLVGGVYNNASNIAPLHYRIYMSDSADTLYTDDTLAVEYYNVGYKANSGKYAASAQLFDLAAAANAQYVGFEFVTAALNNTTLLLSELAVYATYDMTDALTGDITAPSKVYVDGELVANSASVPADIVSGNHTLVVYDNNSNNNVYIVNDGVFTYKSELNNALSTVGVQIRTDDPLGIRFINSIVKDAKATTVKYGAVVAKSAALSSKDLVVDSTDYTTVNGIAYEKGVSDIIFAEDADTVQFTVAIHNIGTKQHLTYYAVRPYMVVNIDGVDYTVYGETYESRPYDVATMALADTEANYSEKVLTYLNNIVDNSSLTAVSQALYEGYGLTEDSVAASVKNTSANNDRLIRVIQKAMRGEDITLGVLGGSITMGANVIKEDRYAKAYSGLLREWLENTFNVKVNLVNAGIGATTSTFGVHRIEKDLLQYNPDLVVLEYAVNETENDTTNKTYEDCVRRILASGEDTALILLFTVRYTEANGYYNNQAAQITIGENYNLPMISYMDCIVPLVEDETLIWKGSTNKGNTLTTDHIHPSYFGHQIISALLSDYIANVAADVTADTVTTPDTMPEALYGATFTNAKFYNSCDLPEEWIVSMGSFQAVHNICNEYIDYESLTHGWKSYSTGSAEPMVLDIPGAKTVTLLMARTRKIANGIKVEANITKADGSVVTGRASNYLDSSNYADTTVIYTAAAGEDITLELVPNFNSLEGEIVILGIMVGFDEVA